ncbi:BON domain-containing protein [Deinococcus sp. UYEF24]
MAAVSDAQLQVNVVEELLFDPSLDAANVAATVHHGMVTLSGSVSNFQERWAAERAVKRVYGVEGVNEELVVTTLADVQQSDADLAAAARHALDWSATVPEKSVQLQVEGGWITLEGVVDWQFQRQDAHNLVARLLGVKGVSNLITLKPQVTPADIQNRIEAAFKRMGDPEAGRVEVEGGKITLRGQLPNWTEIDAAGLAAWNAVGVVSVNNEIKIGL